MRFVELTPGHFSGGVIFLDIDGTLVADGSSSLDAAVSGHVREFSKNADVYLCSNGPVERTKEFAHVCGVSYVDSHYKKPSRRMIERIELNGRHVYVIGDKVLTDGLFALNIGAQFVKVVRVLSERENIKARIAYALDALFGLFLMRMYPMLPYITLLRPTQWTKNALVAAPFFFAGSLMSTPLLLKTLLATVLFCVFSSAVYIINDIRDKEADARHPTKRGRPIASGSVSVSAALFVCASLVSIGVIGLTYIPSIVPAIALYVVLNVLYSFALKNVPIIDILLVASFFILRVVAGGEATNTYLSPWIILCVLFGALFIIIGKRRAELVHASRRRVLAFYTKRYLDVLLVISAMLALAAYFAYSIFGNTSQYSVYSSVFVGLAIGRVAHRLYRDDGAGEYPELLVVKDPWVLGATFGWAMFMFILLYA